MTYITTQQAATILNITRRAVIALIKRGSIQAEKWGRDWMVDQESAERHAQVNRAWKLLHITPRVWSKLSYSITGCSVCGGRAFIPVGIEKYEMMMACPGCGWAEKGE